MVDFYTCCTNGNGNKFVDPGAKINGQYYRDVMLTQHLLPTMSHIAGNMFIFQQDSAPAHRARETIELLSRDTPDFIGPEMWPPNSPESGGLFHLVCHGAARIPGADSEH